MNMHAKLVTTETSGTNPNRATDPHYFRSRVIEKLAEAEEWAVGRLRAAKSKKIPFTLGLKLQAVCDLTASHPLLFTNASKAASIIKDLRPYQELRSRLAHSKLIVARVGEKGLYSFDEAAAEQDMAWRTRVTLHEGELGPIIARISSLTNQLRQQTAGER